MGQFFARPSFLSCRWIRFSSPLALVARFFPSPLCITCVCSPPPPPTCPCNPPTVHALHMGLSSVIFPSLDSLGLQHQNCLLLRVRVTLRPCCTAMRCAPMCVWSHLSYQLVVCLSFSHPFFSDVFVRCVDVFIYLFVGFDLCQITVCVNPWDQLSLGRRGLRAAFFPSS